MRKIPMRMCVGCMQMFPKKELIRIVRSAEGNVSLDFKGKAPGRGSYICKNAECLKKARKAKRLEKAFSSPIADEIYDALIEQIEQADNEAEKDGEANT